MRLTGLSSLWSMALLLVVSVSPAGAQDAAEPWEHMILPLAMPDMSPFAEHREGVSTLERMGIKGAVRSVRIDWKKTQESNRAAGPVDYCTMEYAIDEHGNASSIVMGGPVNGPGKKTDFKVEYAAIDGRQLATTVKAVSTGEEPTPGSETTFSYDEKGRLTKSSRRYPDIPGSPRRDLLFHRDDSGRLTRIELSSEGDVGVLEFSEKGCAKAFPPQPQPGDSVLTVAWEARTRMTVELPQTGQRIADIEYDQHGVPVKWTINYGQRPLSCTQTPTYDAKGNWTRLVVVMKTSGPDGAPVEFTARSFDRTIDYVEANNK